MTLKACKRGHRERYKNGNCAICQRASVAAYQTANPERVRASGAKYRGANPDKRRTRTAAWRKANPERVAAYRAANRDSARAYYAAWRKANPSTVAAFSARHRALKRNAPGRGVTAALWKNCLVESLGLCAYCNERRPLEMDHIEPLARGGEHDVENIAAACRSCNSSKGDTPLLLWLAKKALLRKARIAAATAQLEKAGE